MEKSIGVSARGKPRLTVDGNGYFLAYPSANGVKTWRCINRSCESKVVTFGENHEIDMKKSRFNHVHGAQQAALPEITESEEVCKRPREDPHKFAKKSKQKLQSLEEDTTVKSQKSVRRKATEIRMASDERAKILKRSKSGTPRIIFCENVSNSSCTGQGLEHNVDMIILVKK